MTRRSAAVPLLALLLAGPAAVAVDPPLTGSSGGPAPAADIETTRPTTGAGRLQGRVSIGRRQGVIGAAVLARAADAPGLLFLSSSDARGTFRLEQLPDGEYVVEIRRVGYETVRKDGVEVRAPFRAVVELPMTPIAGPEPAGAASPVRSGAAASIGLSGRVVDADGLPVADAVLHLMREDAAADPRAVRTGRGGRFEIDELPAGRWSLEVRDVGALPIRTAVDLVTDSTLRVTLLRQPADYVPTPLELMPPEAPIPPRGFGDQSGSSLPRTAK